MASRGSAWSIKARALADDPGNSVLPLVAAVMIALVVAPAVRAINSGLHTMVHGRQDTLPTAQGDPPSCGAVSLRGAPRAGPDCQCAGRQL